MTVANLRRSRGESEHGAFYGNQSSFGSIAFAMGIGCAAFWTWMMAQEFQGFVFKCAYKAFELLGVESAGVALQQRLGGSCFSHNPVPPPRWAEYFEGLIVPTIVSAACISLSQYMWWIFSRTRNRAPSCTVQDNRAVEGVEHFWPSELSALYRRKLIARAIVQLMIATVLTQLVYIFGIYSVRWLDTLALPPVLMILVIGGCVFVLPILFGTAWSVLNLARVSSALNIAITKPVCLRCGYCLLGTEGPRCPECGFPIPRQLIPALRVVIGSSARPELDTLFADEYSENKFLEIAPGLSKSRVLAILGAPLAVVLGGDIPEYEEWYYSQPTTKGAYVRRVVYFDRRVETVAGLLTGVLGQRSDVGGGG